MGIVGAPLVGAQNNDRATTRVAPTVGDIILIKILLAFLLSFGISLFNVRMVSADEALGRRGLPLLQASAVVQISSTVSDGRYSLEEIAAQARANGAKIVIFADRDCMQWEYGLWPLRAIIKKTVKSNSVSSYGISRYLKEIEKVQKKNPDLILIPGLEAAPFYYWTGSPLENNLKIKNWHKHMMVLGINKPEDWENMPSLANPRALRLSFVWKDIGYLWPLLLAVFGVYIFRIKKFTYTDVQGHTYGKFALGWKISGVGIIIVALLFLVNNFPFRSLLYDQYQGDRGVLPYQNLIDYVRNKGGLIFWVHPEAEYVQSRGNIGIETKEYSQDLMKTCRYNGFTIFYEGYKKIGRPAGKWDELLKEYCQGARKEPTWVIGGLGFDQTGELSKEMQDLKVMVLLKEWNKEAVLNAFKEGKVYVTMGKAGLRLDSFFIQNSLLDTTKASMGEELEVKGNPFISLKGYALPGNSEAIKVTLIRNGIIIKTFEVNNPFHIEYQDEHAEKGKKGYYRIEITSANGILVANPIFVNYGVK